MADDRITVPEIRKLKELSSGLDKVLNNKEFMQLIVIYGSCIDRLIKEGKMK